MSEMLSISGVGLLHPLLLLPLLFGRVGKGWACAQLILPGYLIACLAWLLFLDANTTSVLFSIRGLRASMVVLVIGIGYAVLRYSRSNLRSDPGEKRFLGWYVATLFAVCVTVTSNFLPLLVLGWTGISFCLHQLLLFYPERPRAILAAHKKFLFARLSEILLAISSWLLFRRFGTFEIDAILGHYQTSTILSNGEQAAALMLVLVALIKSAQMPLHGWLVQVVEAPTPVSALLHAGIVNLGGFLLLLFSPLLNHAVPAQWLILLVAGPGCVLAALVMTTRISIKVALAWSTLAQMGLMLIECALGLYELALLHLFAHSCYKAMGFLSAGEATNRYLRTAYTGSSPPALQHWILGFLISASCVTAIWWLGEQHHSWSFSMLVGVALASLLATQFNQNSWVPKLAALAMAACGSLLYLLLTSATALLLPLSRPSFSFMQDAWVAVLFTALYLLHLCLLHLPLQKWVKSLFISLNAGCYLDEWATKFTLKVWPSRAINTYRINSNPSSRSQVIYTGSQSWTRSKQCVRQAAG